VHRIFLPGAQSGPQGDSGVPGLCESLGAPGRGSKVHELSLDAPGRLAACPGWKVSTLDLPFDQPITRVQPDAMQVPRRLLRASVGAEHGEMDLHATRNAPGSDPLGPVVREVRMEVQCGHQSPSIGAGIDACEETV
jgi:hypothetical protein